MGTGQGGSAPPQGRTVQRACQGCAARLPDGVRFCRTCGRGVQDNAAVKLPRVRLARAVWLRRLLGP